MNIVRMNPFLTFLGKLLLRLSQMIPGILITVLGLLLNLRRKNVISNYIIYHKIP